MDALSRGREPKPIEAIPGLLEVGPDGHVKGLELQVFDSGSQPIHFAAYSGCVELIELLLAKGADPEARDLLGRTPRHHARERDHTEALTALTRTGGKRQPATQRGRLSPIRPLE